MGNQMTQISVIRSTRDQILDAIRTDVFTGRLATGERVSEASLVERFGVSRGPIREALSQLASEGLVISKPNCGVVVAPPAPEAIRELILPIRTTLEVYAIKRVVGNLTDDDFAKWAAILTRMEVACRQQDWQVFPQLDVELHRSIVERAAEPDLLAIWNSIVTRMRAHFWATVQSQARKGDLMALHRHHVELIEVFQTRNSKKCETALAAHIAEN